MLFILLVLLLLLAKGAQARAPPQFILINNRPIPYTSNFSLISISGIAHITSLMPYLPVTRRDAGASRLAMFCSYFLGGASARSRASNTKLDLLCKCQQE